MQRKLARLFIITPAFLLFSMPPAFADCFFCLAHTGQSPTIDFTDKSGKRSLQPEFETDSLGCYDLYLGKLVDCKFSYQLMGIDTNTDPLIGVGQNPYLALGPGQDPIYGGHEHDYGSHPFIYPDNAHGVVQYLNGVNESTQPLTVVGHTGTGFAEFEFTVPQVAGALWVDVNILTFEGYICYVDCELHETISVGNRPFVQLAPLTAPDDRDYVVARNPDTAHPDQFATWGTPYTIHAILSLAQIYNELSPNNTDVISVNDVSLINGGVFDIKVGQNTCIDPLTRQPGVSCTWIPPHVTHREGYTFDLNENFRNKMTNQPEPAVACADNQLLLQAVKETFKQLGGSNYGADRHSPIWLRCENNGAYYHINAYDPANLPGDGLFF